MMDTKNWYLATITGEDGFRLVRAFTPEEARAKLDGETITHFRELPAAAGEAIANDPRTEVATYSYEEK